MRMRPIVLMAAAVTMLWGATAYATSLGTLELKYSSVSPTQTGYVYLNGVSHGNVYIGEYNLKINKDYATTGEGTKIMQAAEPFNYVIGTFCADILQNAPTAYSLYNVYLPADAPIGGGNIDMTDAKAWDLCRLFYQRLGAIGTANGAAAFEACVWEIVYETSGTYDVDYTYSPTDTTRGNFYVQPTSGSGWLATANSWLGALGTDQPQVALRVLVSDGYQDFALTVSGLGGGGPENPDIPEPVTMAGLMMGIGGLVTYVRKRRTA